MGADSTHSYKTSKPEGWRKEPRILICGMVQAADEPSQPETPCTNRYYLYGRCQVCASTYFCPLTVGDWFHALTARHPSHTKQAVWVRVWLRQHRETRGREPAQQAAPHRLHPRSQSAPNILPTSGLVRAVWRAQPRPGSVPESQLPTDHRRGLSPQCRPIHWHRRLQPPHAQDAGAEAAVWRANHGLGTQQWL